MMLQALVKHKGHFTDSNMGWSGKVHDVHIFRNSSLFRKLQAGWRIEADCLAADFEQPDTKAIRRAH